MREKWRLPPSLDPGTKLWWRPGNEGEVEASVVEAWEGGGLILQCSVVPRSPPQLLSLAML